MDKFLPKMECDKIFGTSKNGKCDKIVGTEGVQYFFFIIVLAEKDLSTVIVVAI